MILWHVFGHRLSDRNINNDFFLLSKKNLIQKYLNSYFNLKLLWIRSLWYTNLLIISSCIQFIFARSSESKIFLCQLFSMCFHTIPLETHLQRKMRNRMEMLISICERDMPRKNIYIFFDSHDKTNIMPKTNRRRIECDNKWCRHEMLT